MITTLCTAARQKSSMLQIMERRPACRQLVDTDTNCANHKNQRYQRSFYEIPGKVIFIVHLYVLNVRPFHSYPLKMDAKATNTLKKGYKILAKK